jgi:hypothetical protein
MSFLPSLSPGNVPPVAKPVDWEWARYTEWNRPTEWLDLNKPEGTPEKIIGLVAVFPNSEGGETRNYVAFNLDTNDASTFTVDWGDGNVETVSSNVTHYHVYNYDDITSDTSTMKSTTYRDYRQAKFEITLQEGASFSNISFNVDGPYTSYASVNALYRSGPNILDLFVSTSNATAITLNYSRYMKMCEQIEVRNTSSNRCTTPQQLYMGCAALRSIPFVPYVYTSGTRDYLKAFYGCFALQKLPDDFASDEKYWFKNPSRLQETFYFCYNLRYLPQNLFGDSILANCNTFLRIFRDCRSLRYIPYLGMRGVGYGEIDVRDMFYQCSNLRSIPNGFDFSRMNSSGVSNTFYNLPACEDFSNVNSNWLDDIVRTSNFSMLGAFAGWDKIEIFPYIGQFTRCNNAQLMFAYNEKMERFDDQYTYLDFTNCTRLRGMFISCHNLQRIPPIHVTAVSATLGFYQTFTNCYSLIQVKIVGLTTGPSDGEYYQCFLSCYSLQYISGIDFSYANDSGDYNQTFSQCRNLARIDFPGAEDGSDERGFSQTVSLQYCPLNRDAIVNIFNHLVTTSGKTIDLRNNSYTSDLTAEDIQIATDKGWTVSI